MATGTNSLKKKKARRKPSKKVWHIFHFEERYELPDDARYCRKSPLKFTRDFVGSGQDDEAISYQQQINILRGHKDRLVLRGAFHELKEIAANRSRCYRGYLLDEKFEPASERKIGQWLGAEAEDVKMILAQLEDIGLLERVAVPVFDPSINDDPTPPSDDGEKKASKASKTKKKAASRRRPGTAGKRRPAAEKKDNIEGKQESKTTSGKGKGEEEKEISAKGKQNPPAHLDQGQEETNEMPKGHLKYHPPASTQAGAEADGQALTEALAQQFETPVTDRKPQSMPTMPNAAEIGEGVQRSSGGDCDPPHSDTTSDVNQRLDKIYDPSCQAFASEIFQALRVVHPPDSWEGKRELGCYASAWAEAQKAGVPPSELDRLWMKSLKEAKQLGLKRGRIEFTASPEAVWRSNFGKRLRSLRAGKAVSQRSRSPDVASG